MFYGDDPTGIGYSTRAHLAKVIALLGPPPLDMISRGVRSREFFSEDSKIWRSILLKLPLTQVVFREMDIGSPNTTGN
jgi:hypothetical protein